MFFRRRETLRKIENRPNIVTRSGKCTTDVGIVKLHPTKVTHWVTYIMENCFE